MSAIPPAQGAAVDQAVADPSTFTSDGQTVVSNPLPDVIQADRYRAGNAALGGPNLRGGSRSAWGAVRPAKVVPPGTSNDCSLDDQ